MVSTGSRGMDSRHSACQRLGLSQIWVLLWLFNIGSGLSRDKHFCGVQNLTGASLNKNFACTQESGPVEAHQ